MAQTVIVPKDMVARVKEGIVARGDEDLMWWVLVRARRREAEPPFVSSIETPADLIFDLYRDSHDTPFAHRLEGAIIASLKRVRDSNDLFLGADAEALEHLATLVERIEIRDAYPVLLEIANRGTIGGHPSAVSAHAERALRRALNAIRPQGKAPLAHTDELQPAAAAL